MPTHSDLFATLVSQPSTTQRMSPAEAAGITPFSPGKPTLLGVALVGRRFSKQSAQYTCRWSVSAYAGGTENELILGLLTWPHFLSAQKWCSPGALLRLPLLAAFSLCTAGPAGS